MPYLILIFGLLIGLFALYRFFIKANTAQIKALFLSSGLLAVFVGLLFLTVTGRFPAALALSLALIPLISKLRKIKKTGENESPPPSEEEQPQVNTTEEALKILGLNPGASEEEIQNSYKKLMQKLHPDNEGSDWIAAKLNQARDILLK